MSEFVHARLRKANEQDIPFIFNAWLKSYRNSDFANNIANEIFYSEHHKVIERIVKSYDVIIACDKEDPNQIFGFICAGYTDSIFTLHFVYVKHTFRRMGIATELFNTFNPNKDVVSIYTHDCKLAKYLAKKHNMVYHPYVALNLNDSKPKE